MSYSGFQHTTPQKLNIIATHKMSLTTIPLRKDTRDKLKDFTKKSESWNVLLNRMYENAVASQNAQIFFSSKSAEELLKRIDKW